MSSLLRITSTRTGLLLLTLAIGLPVALAQVDVDDPISARVFEVRHRSITDAAEIADAVMSPTGDITLKPRLKMIVVQDKLSVLDRIEELLRGFDLPPRNVEVTLSLYLGTKEEDADEDDGGRPGRLVDLPPVNFPRYQNYESLGSRSVNGVEGSLVTTELSDDYRVAFTVDDVDEAQKKIVFKSVSVQRVRRQDNGLETVNNLYSVAAVVPEGRQMVLGGSKNPNADSALFLFLKARLRD